MSAIYPFAALRPAPKAAAAVASVPYDVVNTDEARALAEGNPLSFLHVSRPEIELPAGHRSVCGRGVRAGGEELRARCRRRRRSSSKSVPSLYVYRLRMGAHEQTGVAACFSIDEYDRDLIKKHEKTRPDKEDDRTRHMLAIGAQTGPGVPDLSRRRRPSTTRSSRAVLDDAALRLRRARRRASPDLARAGGGDAARSSTRFAAHRALYIADGHHRAASAARARRCARRRSGARRARSRSRGRVSRRPDADPAVQPRREGSARPDRRRVPARRSKRRADR